MTKSITSYEESGLTYTPDQIETIKNTVAKGSSDDELKMFIHICKTYGLDPFIKEIFFNKINGQPTIITSRDGYLKIAHRNSEYDGMKSDVIRKGDKFKRVGLDVEHEYGDERGDIVGAYAVIYRKDQRVPTYCHAPFKDYYKQTGTWRQYPSAMIQKVAESMALKRAFAISGLVTREELDNESEEDKTNRLNEMKDMSTIEYETVDAEIVEENDNVMSVERVHEIRDKLQKAAEDKTKSKTKTKTWLPPKGPDEKDPRIVIWEQYISFFKTKERAKEEIAKVTKVKSSEWTQEIYSDVIEHLGIEKEIYARQINMFPEFEDGGEHAADVMGIPKQDPSTTMEQAKAKMDFTELEKLRTFALKITLEDLEWTEKELEDHLQKQYEVPSIIKLQKNTLKAFIKDRQKELKEKDASGR